MSKLFFFSFSSSSFFLAAGDMGDNVVLKVVAIASSAVFNLAFGIAGLIVHLQNNSPDPRCGVSNSYLTLSQWLEGFGIANILIFCGTLLFAIQMNKWPQREIHLAVSG